MIKVLFIIHVDAYYAGMANLATRLSSSSDFIPVFLFPRRYPNVFTHMKECSRAGICFEVAFSKISNDPQIDTKYQFVLLAKRIISKLINYLPGLLYIVKLIVLKLEMKSIRLSLTNLSPSVIVLGGDIVGHDMSLYIKEARSLNIKSVILPGWMASAREPAELQLYNPDFFLKKPFNWLFCCFYPQWHFHHKGRDLIRLPAQEALALETLGLAPPLPWILHSGYADLIAVESEAARDYGVREGLESKHLVVVGSHTHDVLHSKLNSRTKSRKDLCVNFGLNPSVPLVVCALPPDMLYGKGGRPECEFSSYKELVVGFLEPIQKFLGGRFIVCLHPSADDKEIKFIEKYGAVVATCSVAELIPLADIYVASISATIQWAIACGIPVINYDVYRYRYTDYAEVQGVLSIETGDAYKATLARLIDDSKFRADCAVKQHNISTYWGKIDGNAVERIIEMLYNLAVSQNKS